MDIVFGILAGAAVGAAVAFVNYLILKNSVKKNTNSAVMTGSALRTAVDIAALALIFLTRKVLPFSYEACLLAAALVMGLGSFYFTFRIAKS